MTRIPMVAGEQFLDDPQTYNEFDFLNHLRGTIGVPNIIQHFQVGRERVMMMDKYLATLEQFRTRCDDRRISDLNIIKIAVRLVNVLEAIHQKGVIHRDLKTTNVMIRSRGQSEVNLVLIDYGLSTFNGTPPRALAPDAKSPEIMFRGHTHVSPALEEGLKADAVDDLQMLAIMLIWCSAYHPFGPIGQESSRKKAEFITNPVKYVKGRPFLRPLMTAIMAQPRGTRPNYQAILDAAAGPFPIDDIRDSLKTEISLLGVRFL